MEGVAKSAQKKKSDRCDEHKVVDAPTDIEVNVATGNAVFEARSIDMDRVAIGRDAKASVFALSYLSRATGAIDIVGRGSVGVMK